MPPTLISPDLFDSMSRPLTALSLSKQNTPKSPSKGDFKAAYTNHDMTITCTDTMPPEVHTPTDDEFHDSLSVAPDTPQSIFTAQDGTVVVRSPAKRPSPVKATLFEEDAAASIPEDFETGTVVIKSPVKRMSPVKATLFDDAEAPPEPESADEGTVVVKSPVKRMSPIKNTLFDEAPTAYDQDAALKSSPRKRQASEEEPAMDCQRERSASPTTSPRPALRFNEGLTTSVQQMQLQAKQEEETSMQRSAEDELMSRIYNGTKPTAPSVAEDESELTLSIDDKTYNDLTIGDLSTISAIPADMTRFANLRNSPTKTPGPEAWSPSKQLRNSVLMNTPGTVQRGAQRPLHLLSASRHSNSSNEDEEATPRRRQSMYNESPTDLLNFTGQSNVHIPPQGSAPRNSRRTPSGRGAFPIRLNTSPTHRSQASVDRQAAAANISPQKSYFPPPPQATPAGGRRSQYSLDLLDIDLEPMATPRSIPTVTPRELETLRSELQSRISGLEATLSGKEAEVSALKRSITDAEVRVGKTSEELRNERAGKQDLEQKTTELEKRSREMEEVLREVKQNAFVEEREREKLRREKEEMERRCEERDVKVLELTASLDTLRDQRIQSTPSPQKPHSRSPSKDQAIPQTPGGSIDIDTAVKNATENVARELHALYKGKHERKVADLKTSYEKRWQKQVQDLRDQLKTSQDEVLALQTSRDATMSGVVPNAKLAELSRENDALAAAKGILDAKVAGLEEQIVSVRVEAGSLRKELEQERVEKGELVAQVDLFLSMSAEAEAAKKIPLPESPPMLHRLESQDVVTHGPVPSPSKPASRTSINGGLPKPARALSMLKAPAKYSGLPQPGSKTPARGAPGRGGILEGIARMGAGGR